MGLYLLIPSPAIPSLGKALQDSYLSQSLPPHTHTVQAHTPFQWFPRKPNW